jgi:SET domain-containing protein
MSTIASWMNPSLEVKISSINQRGVYARAGIKEGERLAIFGGDILLIDETCSLPEQFRFYPLQIEERFMLYMRSPSSPEDTDYFNHSCSPNAGLRGQIFLVAMRDILPGEEITFDYCMSLSEFEESSFSIEFDCSCNAPCCRGRVTQKDWRNPELQRRYKGFFSLYIQEKIDRLHITR